jgi:hypothetical protein
MAHTPSPDPLASRLVRPARDLAHRIGSLARRAGRADARAVAREQATLPLSARLHVPVLDEAPECAIWRAIAAEHAASAAQDDWEPLLSALTAADQARTATAGGRRLAALISKGARAGLAEAIAAGSFAAAEVELVRLAVMAASYPDSYAAALILAQAHLDLGQARRSVAAGGQDSPIPWQGYLSHVAEAEHCLDPFDPIAENSPLLAATRYQLLRGLDEGARLFRDWYEDWSDLDPTCPEPHATHAVHLLPMWYGRLEDFDTEARAAMRRTRDVSGASAYAVFQIAAAETLDGLPPGLDHGLFLSGLLDYFHATGCQYRANHAAAAMARLAQDLAQDAPGSMRQRVVLDVLAEHLTDNLRAFHLPAWQGGDALIHWVLEQVFGTALLRGDHILLGPEGIETRLPQG